MRFTAFILLFFIASTSIAQSTVDNVAVALKTSSSKELIKYFSEVTELKVEEKEDFFSKIQAESIVKDFFTKYPAKSFFYIHKGSSPEGLKYNIGRYTSEDGSFRVVILLKQVRDKYLIDSIKFNKE